MLRRVLVPLIFGLAGAAVLISLGVWQLQRLEWKEGILAERAAKLNAPDSPLPADPSEEADQYRPIEVTGRLGEGAIRVLVSPKFLGAGYRIVSPLLVGERRILLDRGFLPLETPLPPPTYGTFTFRGHILWPDDATSSTPEPDLGRNIWFARDVAAMAAALNTEPVLMVLREDPPYGSPLTALEVDLTNIPNDHLQYAITWFSLAAIWAGMTAFYLSRSARKMG